MKYIKRYQFKPSLHRKHMLTEAPVLATARIKKKESLNLNNIVRQQIIKSAFAKTLNRLRTITDHEILN